MAAPPYPAYGYGAAETAWLGMHGLPDDGSALSGLRLGAAKTCMERLKRRRPDKRLRAIRQSVYGDIPAATPYLTAFPFNNLRTHNRFGFIAASVSPSSGMGSLLICAARISAASGALHKPREPSAPIINNPS